MKNLYLYCLILFICLACEDSIIYQEKHVCMHQLWPTTTAQEFSFPITDSTQAYDIILLVTNQPDYPYQNLFVAYTLKTATTQTLQQGLSNCILFEPKTGKPLGEGWFQSKKHQFVVLPGYQFQQPGNYCIELNQFMRTDTLQGIQSIGIQITKARQPAQVIENQ
jgi:gliding motility-associated lipoprotein GldH